MQEDRSTSDPRDLTYRFDQPQSSERAALSKEIETEYGHDFGSIVEVLQGVFGPFPPRRLVTEVARSFSSSPG